MIRSRLRWQRALRRSWVVMLRLLLWVRYRRRLFRVRRCQLKVLLKLQRRCLQQPFLQQPFLQLLFLQLLFLQLLFLQQPFLQLLCLLLKRQLRLRQLPLQLNLLPFPQLKLQPPSLRLSFQLLFLLLSFQRLSPRQPFLLPFLPLLNLQPFFLLLKLPLRNPLLSLLSLLQSLLLNPRRLFLQPRVLLHPL